MDASDEDAFKVDLDSKDGGHKVTVTFSYQSNDRPMTSEDLIVALDMYLTELCRAQAGRNQNKLFLH